MSAALQRDHRTLSAGYWNLTHAGKVPVKKINHLRRSKGVVPYVVENVATPRSVLMSSNSQAFRGTGRQSVAGSK